MPSTVASEPLSMPCKKRRRDDDYGFAVAIGPDTPLPVLEYQKIAPFDRYSRHWADNIQRDEILSDMEAAHDRWNLETSNQVHSVPSQVSPSIKRILPLPLAKRPRTLHDGLDSTCPTHSESRSSPRATKSPPLATRTLCLPGDAGSRPRATTLAATPSMAKRLAPCHICHRRPTKKSDLDSFADCEGCEERTCYICMRECLGWTNHQNEGMAGGDMSALSEEQEALSRSFQMDDAPPLDSETCEFESDRQERGRWGGGWSAGSHKQMICSRCCVEKGTEGHIVCLGCLGHS